MIWVSWAAAPPVGDGPRPPAPPCLTAASHTGKSALHWAAAVNNVEAALVLLKNGANKDMQNNKVGRGRRGLHTRDLNAWASASQAVKCR